MERKKVVQMPFKLKPLFLMALCGVALLSSCTEDPVVDPETPEVLPEQIDPDAPAVLTINGEMFSIPSPVQTAFLLKESGADYDPAYVNSPDQVSSYSTNPKKALNLGVYGADLGYVTLYENHEDAMSYLGAVMNLSEELNLSGAFDKTLIDRFQANLGNKDTTLVLVSLAYRSADNYLKNNERNEIAGLILAGGWLEALYFSTKVAKAGDQPAVVERIGQQKSSLYNLIGLLSKNANSSMDEGSEMEKELIADLEDLYSIFDQIETEYVFGEPEHNADTRTTTLKSKTTIAISDEQLTQISDKVEMIRNKIVQ